MRTNSTNWSPLDGDAHASISCVREPQSKSFQQTLSLALGHLMAQATAENWKDSICGQCGASIVEPRDGDQRRACPKCGSLTRRIVVEQPVQLESLETVTATAAVHIEIAPNYPRLLLNIARTLIGENRCALSIIVAHMACEVATEESLSRAFASKGIKYLQDSVTDLLNGYNLPMTEFD